MALTRDAAAHTYMLGPVMPPSAVDDGLLVSLKHAGLDRRAMECMRTANEATPSQPVRASSDGTGDGGDHGPVVTKLLLPSKASLAVAPAWVVLGGFDGGGTVCFNVFATCARSAARVWRACSEHLMRRRSRLSRPDCAIHLKIPGGMQMVGLLK